MFWKSLNQGLLSTKEMSFCYFPARNQFRLRKLYLVKIPRDFAFGGKKKKKGFFKKYQINFKIMQNIFSGALQQCDLCFVSLLFKNTPFTNLFALSNSTKFLSKEIVWEEGNCVLQITHTLESHLVPILTLPLAGCVELGMCLNLSETSDSSSVGMKTKCLP